MSEQDRPSAEATYGGYTLDELRSLAELPTGPQLPKSSILEMLNALLTAEREARSEPHGTGMREAHVILQSWVLAWEDLAAEELSQPLKVASDHERECYLAAKAWCQKMGPVTPEEAAKYRTASTGDERREALEDADGCFEAALAEGWLDALANGDIERIRDLWERRLSYARNLFPAALSTGDERRDVPTPRKGEEKI